MLEYVPYQECFLRAAQYYHLHPALLIAIAKVESGFNPRAVNINRNGSMDRGIMQINTAWDGYLKARTINPDYLWNPCFNIYVGAMVLKHCQNKHGISWKAVDCYNKGDRARENSLYVWKVYKQLRKMGYYNF